jgi:predicted transposase YbfD/YdcC
MGRQLGVHMTEIKVNKHFMSLVLGKREQRLVLGQMKVEDKSNEITAIPTLLELLDITGSIITIDAMGTQTEIAKKIIENKGDYVLSLKANNPTLYNQVQKWFEKASSQQF